jgi:hypothetical protein
MADTVTLPGLVSATVAERLIDRVLGALTVVDS